MEPIIGPCVTPLVYAAEDGDVNTVKWHMENGTNPNQTKVSIVRSVNSKSGSQAAHSHTGVSTLIGVAKFYFVK